MVVLSTMSKAVRLSDDKAGLSMIEQLHPEATSHVLSLLDYSSLCQLSMTSSLMRKAANDDNLWKSLYHKEFPEEHGIVIPVNGWKAYYAATKTIMKVNSEFFNIIIAKSLDRMRRYWLEADYVTCIRKSGDLYAGREAVMRKWKEWFDCWKIGVDFVDAFDVRVRFVANMALVSMIPYHQVVSDPDPLRITNMFELHNNRWFMVHHYYSTSPWAAL